jgi:dihydropteroate synthase
MRNFEAKDTAFRRIHSFTFNSRTFHKQGPIVMGIVNITPDSFFEKSRVTNEKELLKVVGRMLEEGADLIDLGAVSTRPGSNGLDLQQEIQRLIPAIHSVIKHFPESFVSVDTWRAEVAKAALNEGAFMVNDISGGTFDAKMPELIGKINVPYVIMHTKGMPADMQQNPLQSDQVIDEVKAFFKLQTYRLEHLGASQLIIDPGFGFGKSLDANYTMLNSLEQLRTKDYPMLIGISRKSMIYKLLNSTPEEALNATTALHMYCILNGADILRVHDVKEARQVIDIAKKVMQS